MEIKYILKQNKITKYELAKFMGVSRPTLDSLIDKFESGIRIDKQYFRILTALKEGCFTMDKSKYRCLNNNIIVKIVDDTAVNSNGTRVSGSETRGKRDIVVGEVLQCTNDHLKPGTRIYFSFYAAQVFTLEGETVYFVNYHDVKMIKDN